jgi:ribosomal protein S18 acetylase RimI-like enzyme
MEITIEPMTLSDMAAVLAELDRFWGGRDMRFLHQKVLVQEFGDTCLTARGPDGQIAGYLIGFPAPRHLGYIHAVAVRDSARGTGCGQALYRAFAAAVAAHGADRLKAITNVINTGSVAFHRRLGFDVRKVEDYDGAGIPMMVMTRPLPWTPASASPGQS